GSSSDHRYGQVPITSFAADRAYQVGHGAHGVESTPDEVPFFGDECADAVLDTEQPFAAQDADCLPQGRPADRQPLRQRHVVGELCTGLEATRGNLIADGTGDPSGQGLARCVIAPNSLRQAGDEVVLQPGGPSWLQPLRAASAKACIATAFESRCQTTD